jgi:hypothetical protein
MVSVGFRADPADVAFAKREKSQATMAACLSTIHPRLMLRGQW